MLQIIYNCVKEHWFIMPTIFLNYYRFQQFCMSMFELSKYSIMQGTFTLNNKTCSLVHKMKSKILLDITVNILLLAHKTIIFSCSSEEITIKHNSETFKIICLKWNSFIEKTPF